MTKSKELSWWLLTVAVVLAFLVPRILATQASRHAAGVDGDLYWGVARATAEDSQTNTIVTFLLDRYGPRLTGSPALDGARQYLASILRQSPSTVVALEPWRFGHAGWSNQWTAFALTSPVQTAISAFPVAWTPGTAGRVSGPLLYAPIPPALREEGISPVLDRYCQRFRGAFVLLDEPEPMPIVPEVTREHLWYDPNAPTFVNGSVGEQRAGSGTGAGGPVALSQSGRDAVINRLLTNCGALARIYDGGLPLGLAKTVANLSYETSSAPTGIVLRSEDYAHIVRLLRAGQSATASAEVRNTGWPDGSDESNLVATVQGSGRSDSVVIVGAHLDSWHLSPGATDNASGVAVLMSAQRVVATYAHALRRPVRFVFWTGEEQGMLGSSAYVRAHELNAKNVRAYINVDGGTGAIRKAVVTGDDSLAVRLTPLFRTLERDYATLGLATRPSGRPAVSDDGPFVHAAGIPTISFEHEPLVYSQLTWHSPLDTPERLDFKDIRTSATIVALLAIQLSQDELAQN